MDIVNIVASGNLGIELDINVLYSNLDAEKVQYDPEKFPGLQLRFSQEGPVIIIFSSGSYNIMGAKTHDQVQELYNCLNQTLHDLGISYDSEKGRPEVRNLICKGELGSQVDLDALVIALGLEKVEYEPEQSPFVYYWPDDADCLITVPSNGQCIVTGVTTLEKAEDVFEHFKDRVNKLFPDDEYQ